MEKLGKTANVVLLDKDGLIIQTFEVDDTDPKRPSVTVMVQGQEGIAVINNATTSAMLNMLASFTNITAECLGIKPSDLAKKLSQSLHMFNGEHITKKLK